MPRKNIEEFIDSMRETLSVDLVEYIVRKYIFWPRNRFIIRYQKMLKSIVHRQLVFVSNIIHIDENYCIYWRDNKIIIYNQGNSDYNLSIYNYNPLGNVGNVNDDTFLLTSSNLIVNGNEFTNVWNDENNITNNNITIDAHSSNIVMYIMYI